MIKKLARIFHSIDFDCLGKNNEKYVRSSVSFKNTIEKRESEKLSKHNIDFIDGFRFMLPYLTNLTDNLSEKLH